MLKAKLTAVKGDRTCAICVCEKSPSGDLPDGFEPYDIEIPDEPLLLRQVHGGTVHYIDSIKVAEETRGAFGDGLIVTEWGIPIGISTADCIPIVITDSKERCIAVVHCGWKPVAAGIIENAMSLILNNTDILPEDLSCVMGPGILGEEYEVGRDVADRFPDNVKKIDNGKYLFDLPAEIGARLKKFGLPESAIKYPTVSTYSEEWLPSYRREGENAERFLTLAWLT